VGCLGKPTRSHADRLARAAAGPLVVVLDADAWREGRALAQALRLRGRTAQAVTLPFGRDPGNTSPAQIHEAAMWAISHRVDVDLEENAQG